MLVEERYRRIRTLLKSHGTVSVEHMTQALGVSRETVRRDLVELETAGEIRRVHGGAMLVESELPISVRAGIRVKEKRALARGAQAYIGSGQTLFIDAGTTTAILAEALGSLSGLHVVTNSVAVANELSGERAAKSGGIRCTCLAGRSMRRSARHMEEPRSPRCIASTPMSPCCRRLAWMRSMVRRASCRRRRRWPMP